MIEKMIKAPYIRNAGKGERNKQQAQSSQWLIFSYILLLRSLLFTQHRQVIFYRIYN